MSFNSKQVQLYMRHASLICWVKKYLRRYQIKPRQLHNALRKRIQLRQSRLSSLPTTNLAVCNQCLFVFSLCVIHVLIWQPPRVALFRGGHTISASALKGSQFWCFNIWNHSHSCVSARLCCACVSLISLQCIVRYYTSLDSVVCFYFDGCVLWKSKLISFWCLKVA